MSDRIFAGVWLLLCIGGLFIAWQIHSEYSYEPVGPRPFPLGIIGLMLLCSALMLLRRLALDAALIDPDAYEGVTSAKREYLVERLPELLAGGHRVLVFSQFTGYLKSIARALGEKGIDHLYLDGSTRNRAGTGGRGVPFRGRAGEIGRAHV